MQTEFAREQMISQQIRAWDVLDERVLEALRRVPREQYVPEKYLDLAFADAEIPLGKGRHMLAPNIVGRILQALQATPGTRALVIGSGTGYVPACLSAMGASVRAIEIEIAGAKDTLATKHDLLVLRGEMAALGSELRGEMAALRVELRSEIAKLGSELHAEIHRAISGSTRQMYMALLGHMAMTLGFIYFLNTQLR